MNASKNYKRKIHAREEANLISKLSFFYTVKLFCEGIKKNLDLYEVPSNLKSKCLGDCLEKKWEKLKQNSKTSTTSLLILRLLLSCYGKTFFLLGVVKFIFEITMLENNYGDLIRFSKSLLVLVRLIWLYITAYYNYWKIWFEDLIINCSTKVRDISENGMSIALPYALGKLVSFFDPKQTHLSKNTAGLYASLVIGLKLVNCVYIHNNNLLLAQLGIKMNAAFSALLYRKILKLHTVSSDKADFLSQTVTIITKDLKTITMFISYGNDVWITLVKVAVVSYVLYRKIGVAALIGMSCFCVTIPLQILGLFKIATYKTKMYKQTDKRYSLIKEVLIAIKAVKIYTWEIFFDVKITDVRKKEVSFTQRISIVHLSVLYVASLSLHMTLYVLLKTYTQFGNKITAEIVYFSMSSCYMLIKSLGHDFVLGINLASQTSASLNRLSRLLNATEIGSIQEPITDFNVLPRIMFDNVSLTIGNNTLLTEINITIDNHLTLIKGPINSGKTSLLKLILREYKPSLGSLEVSGRISYSSQEPWLFPSTIRQNILFGEQYCAKRYQKVLEVCALDYDLNFFENGDLTVIENGGMNLSKGQQMRINLARTVYKNSEIYLLDDFLTTLDARVGGFVFEECIMEFLRDKLIILVTSDQNDYHKYAEKIVLISNQELNVLTVKGSCLNKRNEIINDYNHISSNNNDKKENDENTCDEHSRLLNEYVSPIRGLYEEEIISGNVSPKVYKEYLQLGGGFILIVFMTITFIVPQIAISYNDKLLSRWVKVEQNVLNVSYNEVKQEGRQLIDLYALLLVLAYLTHFIKSMTFVWFIRKVSINLHKKVLKSVLHNSMHFFEKHFLGNILNRFSKDFYIIDDMLPFNLFSLLSNTVKLLGIIAVIIQVKIIFILPALILLVLIIILRKYYLKTARCLRRIENASRSPVIGYFISTFEGLPTIRMAKVQSLLCDEFYQHQDLYTSAYFTVESSVFAFSFALDICCVVFVAGIIIYFFVVNNTASSQVGLAITQATLISTFLQIWIRGGAEVENQMTSLERVLEYTQAKQERKSGLKLDNWPLNSDIKFENVYLTYNNPERPTLKNINLHVKNSERLGVVGRTGAGKSSLISALFQLYEIQGRILIDKIDIQKLSLNFLRSKMSVIDQNAVIFTGTVRDNIDPMRKCTDEEIWQIIESVHLKNSISSLEDVISDGLSAGQRQLICMARAIISKSKIIVLDEPTANLDPEHDNIVDNIIEKEFKSSTIIMIGHKLLSILKCHRVIVLDRGEIVEIGVPSELLLDKTSHFYDIVQISGILSSLSV